jgi:hypothetical protein
MKDALRSTWLQITQTAFDPGRPYKILRFDENCRAEVFIGMTRCGQRCLILNEAVPINKPIERDKLSLLYDSNIPGMVLLLSDDTYKDLFDELISSMYVVVKDLASKQDAIEMFRAHFIKWTTFFESDFSSKLSDDAVMGLVGELKVLESLVAEADELSINAVLESWRGPYDESQDFVLDDQLIEVKTIGMRSRQVVINSLQQLTAVKGKDLSLLVNRTFSDDENGSSIRSLVISIRDRAIYLLGDATILYKALGQKGLHPKNLDDYEHLRFGFRGEHIYNVLSDDFPNLSSDNVPEGIISANYAISLSALQPFMTTSKEY